MSFFSVLIARFKSDSPKFFVKLQNFGITLVSAGTAGLLLPVIPNVTWPPIIGTISEHAVVIGTVLGLVSKLTVQDPNKIDTSMTPPTNGKL